MIDLVEVQSSTFKTASIGTNAIVDGRCRLLMVIARQALVTTETEDPVTLRTSSATGTPRYRFSMPTESSTTTDLQINQVLRIGGSGILFEDGMYYTNDESGSVCADVVTVIYTGGKNSVPT